MQQLFNKQNHEITTETCLMRKKENQLLRYMVDVPVVSIRSAGKKKYSRS